MSRKLEDESVDLGEILRTRNERTVTGNLRPDPEVTLTSFANGQNSNQSQEMQVDNNEAEKTTMKTESANKGVGAAAAAAASAVSNTGGTSPGQMNRADGVGTATACTKVSDVNGPQSTRIVTISMPSTYTQTSFTRLAPIVSTNVGTNPPTPMAVDLPLGQEWHSEPVTQAPILPTNTTANMESYQYPFGTSLSGETEPPLHRLLRQIERDRLARQERQLIHRLAISDPFCLHSRLIGNCNAASYVLGSQCEGGLCTNCPPSCVRGEGRCPHCLNSVVMCVAGLGNNQSSVQSGGQENPKQSVSAATCKKRPKNGGARKKETKKEQSLRHCSRSRESECGNCHRRERDRSPEDEHRARRRRENVHEVESTPQTRLRAIIAERQYAHRVMNRMESWTDTMNRMARERHRRVLDARRSTSNHCQCRTCTASTSNSRVAKRSPNLSDSIEEFFNLDTAGMNARMNEFNERFNNLFTGNEMPKIIAVTSTGIEELTFPFVANEIMHIMDFARSNQSPSDMEAAGDGSHNGDNSDMDLDEETQSESSLH